MTSMKTSLIAIAISTFLGLLSSTVYADPPVPPFYEDVIKLSPSSKLGQVLKREKSKLRSRVRKLGRLPTSPLMLADVSTW